MLIYAWNFCPIPGTDISRSLVAVGCEFAFPIDYSEGKHWELVSSPSTVMTYSKDLAMRLTACRAIAELLIKEHCAYHREFINANRPNPRVYAVSDIVFALKLFGWTHGGNVSTSCNTPSPDLGRSLPSYLALLMS